MAAHFTPRMVYQQTFRRAWRMAHAPSKKRRMAVGMAAQKKIRNQAAWEAGKQFNIAHGLSKFPKKKRIKGWQFRQGFQRKVTMPATKMKNPEDYDF